MDAKYKPEDEECPVCGYYCLGRGGICCIDKPGLVRCYASQVATSKRRVGWFHWGVLFVGIILIVYSQSHDTVAVEMPVVDTALMQRYQVELDLTRKQRDDYKKQAELTKKMLLASNTKLAQYEQHLKALAESVPTQAVILQAIQKEAATEAGFRKLVARHFGADIAKRVRVVE